MRSINVMGQSTEAAPKSWQGQEASTARRSWTWSMTQTCCLVADVGFGCCLVPFLLSSSTLMFWAGLKRPKVNQSPKPLSSWLEVGIIRFLVPDCNLDPIKYVE